MENAIIFYDLVKDKPFSVVKRIYFDKDNLISDKKEIDEERSSQSKRDKLIRHLFKIQAIVELYEMKDYNEFIRKTSFRIRRLSDKKVIKKKIDTVVEMKKSTIAEVISYAHESGLCLRDDNIENFIKENEYLFNPSHPKCNQSVLMRTQKLFYVCCTRAMENLVVYCKEPTKPMIETAEKWFGKDNCQKI